MARFLFMYPISAVVYFVFLTLPYFLPYILPYFWALPYFQTSVLKRNMLEYVRKTELSFSIYCSLLNIIGISSLKQ